jgi:hypothetical protein
MKIKAGAQDASPVISAAAPAEFDAEATYLDTATFGLPPARSRRHFSGPSRDGGPAPPTRLPATCRSPRPGSHTPAWPAWIHPW